MTWDVVDLFSGGGGASTGFHRMDGFRVVGAADAQMGKPSTGPGALACNSTYAANIGVEPVSADLGSIDPDSLGNAMNLRRAPSVLISCPPCTGFSRTTAKNHLEDDSRNGLVGRTGLYVEAFRPDVLVMENARELVMGRFASHLHGLVADLQRMGYRVAYGVHMLSRFGLPQKRERAVVIAVRDQLPILTLDDLWDGLAVDVKATHVRRAIWHLPSLSAGDVDLSDPMHTTPRPRDAVSRRRTAAIPHDGGSWFDLADHPDNTELLTPTMRRRLAKGDLGSHPDVYGRMWWDRPAPTIKRECSHVGNGRYTHPEQDRLCSVREMAILNGFPTRYEFTGGLGNMYRHIGDAVPPLIAYQLASLTRWILTGVRPAAEELIMHETHLRISDIQEA